MWRLTLLQMRRSAGRLAAAAVAIAIGTAFVSATLLAGDLMRRISTDSITAGFGTADLIASVPAGITDAGLAEVRAEPGVAAADPQVVVPGVQLSAGGRSVSQALAPVPSAAAFDTQHVTAGELPSGTGQITLPEQAAERLGVTVGDTVTVTSYQWVTDDTASAATTGADGEATSGSAALVPVDEQVTLVGLTTDPRSAWAQYGGVGQAELSDVLAWSGSSTGSGTTPLAALASRVLLVDVADGADRGTVQAALTDLLSGPDGDARVLTRDDAAEYALSDSDGGTGPITVVVLSFAAVALLVAGLVIANTFQVLVAQRTRTLALLRCVGAVRGQVRRSVLLEAVLLGLLASVAGLLLGTGLVQLTLWGMQRADLPFPVPGTVHLTLAAVLAPLVVGTLVTVLAALSPARAATRVSPVAALRPADAATVGARTGRVRLVLGLLMVLGGGALLALGVWAGAVRGEALGVLVAILGGAASFVGLLVTAVLWMPRVVAGIGGLVGRLGMPARLAAANAGRNPARTAATSTALLIGVTLVAMMSTGAATARSTLDGELDSRYPVDLEASSATTFTVDGVSVAQPLPSGTLDRLREVAGVAAAVPVTLGNLHVGGDDGLSVPTQAVDPGDASAVLRDADLAGALTEGTLAVPQAVASDLGVTDGDRVPVTLTDETTGDVLAGAPVVDLTVAVVRMPGWTSMVTTATLDELGSTAPASTVWVRLDDVNASGEVVQQVKDVAADDALDVVGAAVERASYQRAIDVLLAVVIGLLAVAVVIALVGVTNTLSLSVIERRRESATLRALGLTRRQLRASMAVEGTLIAGTGAVVGVLLGLLYGWAGSASVLGSIGTVELRVPWTDLGLVLVVAVVAGVVASVLPGRSAARTPPVAALAVA
jgi:putative ABC transport system permease protein